MVSSTRPATIRISDASRCSNGPVSGFPLWTPNAWRPCLAALALCRTGTGNRSSAFPDYRSQGHAKRTGPKAFKPLPVEVHTGSAVGLCPTVLPPIHRHGATLWRPTEPSVPEPPVRLGRTRVGLSTPGHGWAGRCRTDMFTLLTKFFQKDNLACLRAAVIMRAIRLPTPW